MVLKSEQQIKKAEDDSLKLLKAISQQIDDTTNAVIPLYDAIENYFFQEINYKTLVDTIPLWMVDAGRSSESGIDKVLYEQLRSKNNDSISNRIIHWADVRGILAAFQDRVMAVKYYLEVIYKYLPTFCLYEDYDYEGSTIGPTDTSEKVHTAINNVFVSLCSSFDLFTKVVYECSEYDLNYFARYTKLKSRKDNILYSKRNYGFNELKAEGLLYSEPTCVRAACSFRDEFIHNGAWDYRCVIYYPYIKGGVPVEPFVLMPDVDEAGNLTTSGSRNKFYARKEKINVFLPKLVKDVMEILNKTVEALINLLQKKTAVDNKEEATFEAMLIILGRGKIGKKMIMGSKYTNQDLIMDVDSLMPHFHKTHQFIAELCKDITLTKGLGQQLIHGGETDGRPYRMLMFVLLLNETANLKADAQLGYHLLKEAYLMTDNIYGQLKHTTYSFVLADYLTKLETALPNRNSRELQEEEKEIYDKLPRNVKVYRGMCEDEKQSGQFGISWTQDKDHALKYIFYQKNKVKGKIGYLAEMDIDKNEIFAVWGVAGCRKEILISPKKCINVKFHMVTKD